MDTYLPLQMLYNFEQKRLYWITDVPSGIGETDFDKLMQLSFEEYECAILNKFKIIVLFKNQYFQGTPEYVQWKDIVIKLKCMLPILTMGSNNDFRE